MHALIGLADILIKTDGMPQISPNYNFPLFSLLAVIASWVVGAGTILSFIALTVGFILIMFKGFGNQSLRKEAGERILWAAFASAGFGSLTAIMAWTQHLDLGFTKL